MNASLGFHMLVKMVLKVVAVAVAATGCPVLGIAIAIPVAATIGLRVVGVAVIVVALVGRLLVIVVELLLRKVRVHWMS